ncbi:MAG: hypothetical protein A3I77_08555 [Gammaproteobacteria bacterium RIFCSPLOWO2_02_FULL_42_14]|nr:MAG: hypothetical protein A3B71_07180 [Gammaproteobacteria bacterium RIFCSPHIGHO2_02_FULL_42_43]OGT28925.1 MAG: hypothetical protein A2624_02105 [Gammaproteobacteria bacterium RIFCSPHIGHO2_01_FULL_42_8]OGT53623.1 MAG: hypothetical protein A3E54_02760 [Gammaproteobacteria bacterium RIFCSPHIGHO2_12_FULL_41_25]OGT61674.1 MAG: hypothetical protein A3I77_08555 [Gammaproteobacteria bacterium RIFCSPLOWO2_02_FULL_42_14]OGT85433.1 MAG: hypothetical protein A3G86_08265 [Gammaproteobacteria bacterium R
MKTIGERLTHLLQHHHMTQQMLADKIKVTKQTVSQLCANKIYHSKTVYPIAKFFGVDLDWLVSGKSTTEITEHNNSTLVLNKFHKIPVFTTRMLEKSLLKENQLTLTATTPEYELTDDPDHAHLFAMTSTNNAMKIRFGTTSTLIFHTRLQAHDGDFVIVYLPDKDLFIYRDLTIEKNKKLLIPLDDDLYKPLAVQPNDLIVAVLYEKRIKREINTLSKRRDY